MTTTQDYALFNYLNEYSIDLWKRQIELIMEHHGLINLHCPSRLHYEISRVERLQVSAGTPCPVARREEAMDSNAWRG